MYSIIDILSDDETCNIYIMITNFCYIQCVLMIYKAYEMSSILIVSYYSWHDVQARIKVIGNDRVTLQFIKAWGFKHTGTNLQNVVLNWKKSIYSSISTVVSMAFEYIYMFSYVYDFIVYSNIPNSGPLIDKYTALFQSHAITGITRTNKKGNLRLPFNLTSDPASANFIIMIKLQMYHRNSVAHIRKMIAFKAIYYLFSFLLLPTIFLVFFLFC